MRDAAAPMGAAASFDTSASLVGEVSNNRSAQKFDRPVSSERALYAVAATWRFSIGQGLGILLACLVSGIGYNEITYGIPGSIAAFVAIGFLSAVLFAGAMRQVDITRRLRRPGGREALRDATFVWIGVVLLITFTAFALKAGAGFSRGVMLSFFALAYFLILMSRRLLPALIAGTTEHAAKPNVLVIGAKQRETNNALLYELYATGCPDPSYIELDTAMTSEEWHANLPVSLGEIFAKTRENGFGDICINADGFSPSQLHSITDALKVVPRGVRIVPAPQIEALLHLPIRSIGEIYSVELQRVPMGPSQLFMKRALDLIAAVPLLVFLSPLLLMIALAIKLDSKGPVIFAQRRRGYRGEAFRILKFRTMTTTDDGDEVTQTTRQDARVTRVGYWLRRLSWDEFPQLLNVVTGEMSLVGPRPHAVAHDKHYAQILEHYEVRQHVKPGITGWAQVNGSRGSTETPEMMSRRVELDLWYAKNANVLLDLKILFLTAGAVVMQQNAY